METLQAQLQRYLKAAWQRRWVALGTAWLVCALGWAAIHFIPNRYEVSARVYVDADAVLTPLLKGVAADSAAPTQLDILQRTLLSRPNLQKLISKTDLDLGIGGEADRERLIQALATEIKIEPQTRTLFTIGYRDRNPRLAYDVVQTLLGIFVENATGTNRADMENARRFVDRQIAAYEVQLGAAEKRRAEFRERYLNILPQDNGADALGASRLDQLREQVVTLSGQLQDAIIRRDALRQALATAPQNTGPGPVAAAAPAAGGGSGRLAQAEEQLRDLRLRYTDAHPDVIAVKQLIASLRSEPGAGGGRVAGGARRPAGGPDSGSEQVRLRLIDAEASVASLQRQLDEATKERDQLDALARQAPAVQAEYKALDRDYSVMRRSYEELLARREQAQLAEAADTQADKVKLTIVDPPQVPRLPVWPNRIVLTAGVLAAGIGAGGAIAFLLVQFDRSFRTIDDLRAIGLPVLGGISRVGAVVGSRHVFGTLAFAAGLLALFVAFGGLLALVLRSQAMV